MLFKHLWINLMHSKWGNTVLYSFARSFLLRKCLNVLYINPHYFENTDRENIKTNKHDKENVFLPSIVNHIMKFYNSLILMPSHDTLCAYHKY